MRLSPRPPQLLWMVFFLSAFSAVAHADFIFTSQSAAYDPASGNVTFTLQFNQAPDFATVDQQGRQADAFQYDILGDPSAPYPSNFDSIVRGEELHLSGSDLRLRNSAPPSSDPGAGGWGSIRGAVSFSLDGDALSFSAPLNLLSDHSTDGQLTYLLLTTEFGSQTAFTRGQTTIAATPEPSSLALLATGLLGALRVARRRGPPKHRHNSPTLEEETQPGVLRSASSVCR